MCISFKKEAYCELYYTVSLQCSQIYDCVSLRSDIIDNGSARSKELLSSWESILKYLKTRVYTMEYFINFQMKLLSNEADCM